MSREFPIRQIPQIRLYETVVLRYNLPVGNAERGRVSASGASPAPTPEGTTDMDVRSVGPSIGAVPVKSTASIPSNREVSGNKPVSPKDELELSAAGKMLDQLSQTPDLRQERLARIKAEIENGTYDTDAKLEAALSKMFDSLGLDAD